MTALRSVGRVPPGIWIFVLSFLIQSLVLQRIAESPHFLPSGSDMRFYNEWAQKILGLLPWHASDPNAPGGAFYGLPGYPYAVAAIYQASGGYDEWYSPFVVAQIQALLHAGTATLLFLLARLAFSEGTQPQRLGTGLGVAAAGAWVAFTPAQVFSSVLMPSAWGVFAFWLVVYRILRLRAAEQPVRLRSWFYLGCLSGVAALISASVLILLPLAIAAIGCGLRNWPLRRNLVRMAAAVGVLVGGVYLGCSPAWVHNYWVANDPVLLSAHDGINFYLGNHYGADGYTSIPAELRASQEGLLQDSIRIPENMAGAKLRRADVSAFWKEKGWRFIRENPGAWMRLLLRKAANFWSVYEYDDLTLLRLLRTEAVVLPGFRFGFFAAFAVPGMFLCCWGWPRAKWIVGAVVLHLLALMPVFVTERYRLSAAPGVILLACGGVAFFWQSFSERRWARAGVYLALLLAGTGLAGRIAVGPGAWGLDYYKAGLRHTGEGLEQLALARGAESEARSPSAKSSGMAEARSATAKAHRQKAETALGRAQIELETANRFVPTNPEFNFALGVLWFYRNDFIRAESCYQKALRNSPSDRPHDGALNNLGILAMEQRRWREAEQYFSASIAADPADATTWFSLARARRQLGDRRGAEAALNEAEKRAAPNAETRAFRESLNAP